MPDLTFRVENATVEPFAAAPLLLFELRIDQVGAVVPIHAVVLRCQVRLDPAKRQYSGPEREGLRDLFGTPDRWGQTLRPMLWTHTSVMVPPFGESVVVELPVPCTFDFNVATTKYFHALEDGEAPLSLLFSGTIFHEREGVGLQVAQIPWDREAKYRLAVSVWQEMMKRYYPDGVWLCLRQDVFDRLHRYKIEHGLLSWEQTLEKLLGGVERRGLP